MLRPLIAAGLLGLAQPVPAQLPDLGGALSGLGGGLLPDVGSVGASNAAGLLGYCVKHQLLGSANAGSVLGKLTGNPSVTGSPEYAAGQSGQLVTGDSTLSLAGLKDKLKGRVEPLRVCRRPQLLRGRGYDEQDDQ